MNLSKRINFIWKSLVVFSVPFLVLFLSYSYRLRFRLITAGLAFVLIIFLIRKIHFKKVSYKLLGITFITSCYIDKLLMSFYNFKIPKIINLINKYIHIKFTWNSVFLFYSILVFFSLFFFVFLFYYYIVPKIKEFISTLTKEEKIYLVIILFVSVILCSFITTHTVAFGKSNENYDVIYTSDSSSLVKSDAWININNPENDIRQPLFGLFSLPFGILGHFISDFVFFLPQPCRYEFALMVIQFIVLGVVTIMLSRLVVKDEKMRKFFYGLFSLSFPYLIFGLILEQYVFGLFYLILCIYHFYHNEKGPNYPFIGAVGTLLTSGVLFGMTCRTKKFKEWFVTTFKLAMIFLVLMIFTGQFTQVFTLKDKILFLLRFTGEKVTFINRFYQYMYFVRSLFVAPCGFIYYGAFFDQPIHYSYQLIMPSKLSIIGTIVMLLMLISLILNRKNKLAKISAFWIAFSFIILCLVGWGSQENGLILYSLYFSWAFYVLFYLLLEKIFKNKTTLKIILSVIVIIFLCLNCRELYNILQFAFSYYIR